MRTHKVTFVTEWDEQKQTYHTRLEHQIHGNWGHNELTIHLAEIFGQFGEQLSKAKDDIDERVNRISNNN